MGQSLQNKLTDHLFEWFLVAQDSNLAEQYGDVRDSLNALKDQLKAIMRNINTAEGDSADSAEGT